jgi:hypothetical protein
MTKLPPNPALGGAVLLARVLAQCLASFHQQPPGPEGATEQSPGFAEPQRGNPGCPATTLREANPPFRRTRAHQQRLPITSAARLPRPVLDASQTHDQAPESSALYFGHLFYICCHQCRLHSPACARPSLGQVAGQACDQAPGQHKEKDSGRKRHGKRKT